MIAADFDVKHTVPSTPVTARPTTRTTTQAATTTTTSTTTTTTTRTTEEYIATTKEAVVEPEVIEEDVVEPEVSEPEVSEPEVSDSEDSSSIDSRDDYDPDTWGDSDNSDTSYTIDNNSDVNAGEAPGSDDVDSERSDYGEGEIEDEYTVDGMEKQPIVDYAERSDYDTEVPDVVTLKPAGNSYEDPMPTEKIIDTDYVRTSTVESKTLEDPDVYYPDANIYESGINSGALGGNDEDEGSADGAYFESDDEEENEYSNEYDSEELKRSRRHKYKRAVTENERKYRGSHIRMTKR